MSSWKKIARVLAKEASYRALKRRGRKRFFTLGTGDLVKSNLLGILLLSAFSLMTSVGAIFEESLFVLLLGTLCVLEIFFGTFSMATNIQTILGDNLLEPISHLPVSQDEVRKAILRIGLYWGGLSLPFTVIPGAALMAWKLRRVSVFIWGAAGAASILFLANGLGYLIGALSYKIGRNPLGRALSTIVWLLFFSFGILFNLFQRFSWGDKSIAAKDWIVLIPPFSFAGASLGELSSMVTSLITAILSVVIFKVGANRFWAAVAYGHGHLPTTSIMPRWTVRAGKFELIRKDLKLLARNPRILASTIYYMLVFGPLIFLTLVPARISKGSSYLAGLSNLIPAASLLMGGIGGISIFRLYTLEAEGARVLYNLPLSRSKLARLKACSLAVVSLPMAFAVGVCAGLVGGAVIGICAGLTYVISLVGSALLNSSLLTKQLPREPSSWTQETFGRFILVIIMLGEVVFFSILAGLPLVPSILIYGFPPPAYAFELIVIPLLEAVLLVFASYLYNRWIEGCL